MEDANDDQLESSVGGISPTEQAKRHVQTYCREDNWWDYLTFWVLLSIVLQKESHPESENLSCQMNCEGPL